jgi:hypothetical protein
MQQVQPHFIMVAKHSQQAWIMSQQALSPLVQVRQQPSLVISHLQLHMTKLQQHTIMPFIMAQQPQVPPAIMLQRFCIMLQAMASSHEQVTFMPPVHFSNFMVQRGTIITFGADGMVAGAEVAAWPMPMPVIIPRSIIIVAIETLLLPVGPAAWMPE